MTKQELINKVRTAIRDLPEFNTLGDNKPEFSDTEISEAIDRAVNRINITSPITNFTAETLPPILIEPLIYHTISILLQMRIRELSRNNVDYQSGGTAVSFNTIIAEYAQAAAIYEEKAEILTSKVKIQANLESGFGTIESPFWYFGWW
ncbi:MAG: hypothetical protein DSY42_09385 [Aquifex sp.]|nr:MAG: hypothetical protein DSY42_09385 [Aquifex sp.]